jgi:hypothetical protein
MSNHVQEKGTNRFGWSTITRRIELQEEDQHAAFLDTRERSQKEEAYPPQNILETIISQPISMIPNPTVWCRCNILQVGVLPRFRGCQAWRPLKTKLGELLGGIGFEGLAVFACLYVYMSVVWI